jgi:hypothetical protein
MIRGKLENIAGTWFSDLEVNIYGSSFWGAIDQNLSIKRELGSRSKWLKEYVLRAS